MNCVVCGAAMHRIGERFDDRYGYPGRFAVFRCAACRHIQLAAGMSAHQIELLYTEYYPRSERGLDDWHPPDRASGLRAWWHGARASAFTWVPPTVRVLDVGCGFGESLGYHLSRGCDAYGVEADANILRIAERHGLKVKHGLFDPGHYERSSFDVVTLDQVIEHLADPVSVLRGIREVLKPGGQLILSTPNPDGWGVRLFGNRWIHWHAPYHLQFFSKLSLERAAAKAGLLVERRQTITQSSWLDFQLCHLATYPLEGQPSGFWSSRRPRTMAQRVALRLARLPQQLGVIGLLTRLMDALQFGDNSVYILRRPTS